MPTNKTEYMREYMRRFRAEGRDKGSLRNTYINRDFVGADGEGFTDKETQYHAYFMLTVGTETILAKKRHVRLSTLECLEFITQQDPKKLYVSYFFDYDVAKILEDLPFNKLERLVNRGMRSGINGMLFPVDYGPFQLDYLPHKEFKARKLISRTEDETKWTQWVVISDVGSFFQMSFLRALEVWDVGTDEQREQIRKGKLQRAVFDIVNSNEIESYNALEIALLQQLMDKFRDACVQAGYIPKKWQGPGQLAETMLRTHGVSKSKDVPLLNDPAYHSLLEYGRNAYYGGRFEVAAIGPVDMPVGQHDINSAYPHAMRFLPCLEHGGWEFVSDTHLDTAGIRRAFSVPTGRVGESFAIISGSFKPCSQSQSILWYGLPMRTSKGGILYPGSGKGWYWSFEIGASAHQDFSADSMWIYTRQCSCRPLAFVEKVYENRKRLGKDGPGLVLKLGLNSLYGKMVQSIGFPKYSNAIWGSFITAFPRVMIQDFIHSSPLCSKRSCGKDVIMIATDSVATIIERPDIQESSELGGWSYEAHPNGMFVVQPGVYFGSSGKPTKTRGFTRTIVDSYEPEFRRAYEEMVRTGDLNVGHVALPIQIFVGIRYALQRKNLKLLGQWLEYGNDETKGKILSFDWTSKRMPAALNPTKDRGWIMTFPYEGAPDIETIPYSKDIGGLIERGEDRLAFDDLPDWSSLMDVYDGA